MVSVLLHRSRTGDSELARRVGAGDARAFAALDARHRTALTRYAGALLRRCEHDAEDVVQDVLIRAHQALRAGDVPDELRPWLYRLTRNRAIDEVRRKRWGDESLESDTVTGDGREEPETMLRRKEAVRRLVEDLADLPLRQREALLGRELDDQTAEQIAARLGVSVTAAHNLASRARANLIKARDARDADCPDIRTTLLEAHERGVRPTEHALRHVRGCDACRAHQRDIRRLSKQLHALNPALGLPVVGAIVKLAGGGMTKAAAGVAVLAVAVAATGGIVVLRSEMHSAGDPAPFRLISIRDSKGRVVTRGKAVPEGFTVVTARIRLPAGPSTLPRNPRGPYPTVTLPCPAGMKLGSLQLPARELPLRALGYAKNSIPGYSTSGQIQIAHRGLARPLEFTVGIDCRRPNAYGGLSPDTRRIASALERGERRLGHVCTKQTGVILRSSPDGRPQGFLSRGAPVAIQRRSASGTWTRVVPDQPYDARRLLQGWMRTREICA